MILVFDTETTGKFLFERPVNDPKQPRIVSLGALGFSDDGQQEVAQFYRVIRPDGFTIPEEASRIHGITQDFAMANGVDGFNVIDAFMDLFMECTVAIAFNSQFDFHMIKSEALRRASPKIEIFDRSKIRCAMLAASSCMKQPNQYGYEGYAWPKLSVAYKWMFGQEMAGAHHAIHDVRATGWLSLAMRNLGYWDIHNDKVLV